MSKQTINIGASPNDGTGTPLRTSFDYCNQNFTELYTATGPSGNNIVVPGNATITGDLTVDTSTLKVDSTNNRVGIGTATPSQPLHVKLDQNAYTFSRIDNQNASSGAYAALMLAASGNTWGIGIGSTAANSNALAFFLDAGGANSVKMSLNSTGNLVLTGGTAAANGVGVTFPATQVASSDANCLDDYEEGTFVPNIGGTATYTTRTGRYTKIGNRVYVNMRLVVLLVGTGSNYQISGLPFTSAASSAISPVSVGYFANLATTVNYISGYINDGTSAVTMTGTAAAATSITNGFGVIGNTADLALSFFYEV